MMNFLSLRTAVRLSAFAGLTSLVTLVAVPSSADAITVLTTPRELFPFDADIVTMNELADVQAHDTSNVDDSVFTLAQTFSVPSAIDIQNIFVIYGNSTGDPIDVGVEIFSVDDVNGESLPQFPGSLLLDTTVSIPARSDNTVLTLSLDTPLNLPASVGTGGYAIRFDSPEFRWGRTGGGRNNVYDGGRAYESGQGGFKGGGDLGLFQFSDDRGREFSLALSASSLPALPIVNSIQNGDINAATTWEDGLAPSSGNRYHVTDGFTVTSSSTSFAGGGLSVLSGGTLNLTEDLITIPLPGGDDFGKEGLEVLAGGVINANKTGDFTLGDIAAPTLYGMKVNGELNVNASPGADAFLDVNLVGDGTINFQGNGATSDLWLSFANDFGGTIRFNGTADTVRLAEGQAWLGTLEMNSTGANTLRYESDANTILRGTLVFNEPGVIDHASERASGDARWRGPQKLIANAPVTIDLTKTFPAVGGPRNERRLMVSRGIEGNADITINGTATDPTGGQVTLNEFESQNTDETEPVQSGYSGTITSNNYVALEMRQNYPQAGFVINSNGVLEMGFRRINTLFELEMGEIEVKSGATLIVGYEEDGLHGSQGLRVTTAGGRSGDLTLAAGSTTVMQVSGSGPNESDRVVVEGDLALGGTLRILVNPPNPANLSVIPSGYSPTLGDTFDLFAIGGTNPDGDYDGNGSVGQEDFTEWKTNFGSTTSLDADGNGDGIVNIADYTIWRDNLGAVGAGGGTLTGTFSSLQVDDPGSVLANAGLAFALNYTADLVQLEVVSAGSIAAATAVPEPASVASCAMVAFLLIAGGRRRSSSRHHSLEV